MARRRPRPTDTDTRVRNRFENEPNADLAGLMRYAPGATREIAPIVASVLGDPGAGDQGGSAAQHLVMSTTADSIASGGDHVTFDTIVALRGFDAVAVVVGDQWTHPVTGEYILDYEHEWTSYEGGGTVELEVDGAVPSDGQIGSGSGQYGRATIPYWAEKGQVGKIKVTQTSGSAQTCDATVRIAVSDPDDPQGEEVEEVFFDTRVGSISGSIVLDLGRTYRLLIDGNARVHVAGSVDEGTPDAVIYPSASQGASNEAEIDYDTVFASNSPGTLPDHYDQVEISLDGGSSWAHVEPNGGPYSSPQTDHLYEVDVVGEGQELQMRREDPTLTDNNGQFRIRVVQVG